MHSVELSVAFFAELQVQELHNIFNELDVKELDHMHSRGTKCVDSLVATPNIRKHTEGSRMFETSEIMITDHRAYRVDINLEEYFQKEFSGR